MFKKRKTITYQPMIASARWLDQGGQELILKEHQKLGSTRPVSFALCNGRIQLQEGQVIYLNNSRVQLPEFIEGELFDGSFKRQSFSSGFLIPSAVEQIPNGTSVVVRLQCAEVLAIPRYKLPQPMIASARWSEAEGREVVLRDEGRFAPESHPLRSGHIQLAPAKVISFNNSGVQYPDFVEGKLFGGSYKRQTFCRGLPLPADIERVPDGTWVRLRLFVA